MSPFSDLARWGTISVRPIGRRTVAFQLRPGLTPQESASDLQELDPPQDRISFRSRMTWERADWHARCGNRDIPVPSSRVPRHEAPVAVRMPPVVSCHVGPCAASPGVSHHRPQGGPARRAGADHTLIGNLAIASQYVFRACRRTTTSRRSRAASIAAHSRGPLRYEGRSNLQDGLCSTRYESLFQSIARLAKSGPDSVATRQ